MEKSLPSHFAGLHRQNNMKPEDLAIEDGQKEIN